MNKEQISNIILEAMMPYPSAEPAATYAEREAGYHQCMERLIAVLDGLSI